MERHVAFVAVAEVGADVGRPLVGLGEEHAVLVVLVEPAAHALEHVVRLREVLARRSLALDEIGDRVEAQAVHAEIQPEAHDLDDLLEDLRVVVVQVGLMMEEPVPVVLLGDRIPGPVRFLGVGEDDPRVLVLLVAVAPHVVVALGRALRRAARPLKPRMLVGRVVDDELGEHAEAE